MCRRADGTVLRAHTVDNVESDFRGRMCGVAADLVSDVAIFMSAPGMWGRVLMMASSHDAVLLCAESAAAGHASWNAIAKTVDGRRVAPALIGTAALVPRGRRGRRPAAAGRPVELARLVDAGLVDYRSRGAAAGAAPGRGYTVTLGWSGLAIGTHDVGVLEHSNGSTVLGRRLMQINT